MKYLILLLLISCSSSILKVGECFVEKGNIKSWYEQEGMHKIRSVTKDTYHTFFYTSKKWDRSGDSTELKRKHPAWNISVVFKGINDIIKVPCYSDKEESIAFSKAIEVERKEHKRYYKEHK